MNILAFESSCDETAVAVVRDGRQVLSDAILSQADMHALYGGVVPEIASRKHVAAIAGLTDQALRDAGLTLGWMADAHDLQRGADGQALCARVVGTAVDIGCFEYAPLGGLLFLVR